MGHSSHIAQCINPALYSSFLPMQTQVAEFLTLMQKTWIEFPTPVSGVSATVSILGVNSGCVHVPSLPSYFCLSTVYFFSPASKTKFWIKKKCKSYLHVQQLNTINRHKRAQLLYNIIFRNKANKCRQGIKCHYY